MPDLSANCVGLFAIGMLAAQVSFGELEKWQKLRRLPWFWLAAVSGMLMALVCLRLHFAGVLYRINYFDVVVGATVAATLIGCTARPESIGVRLLNSRPLVALGAFSYSLYLIHAPILQIIWQYLIYPLQLNANVSFALLAGPGLVIIVVISYLFHLGFERPFMNNRLRQ